MAGPIGPLSDDMTALAPRSRSGRRVRPLLLAMSLFALLFTYRLLHRSWLLRIKRLGFRAAGPATGLRSFSISGSALGSPPLQSGSSMRGLILWAANRYKTTHAKMPRQNRYNLPMEDLLHDRAVHRHRRALLLHGPGPKRRPEEGSADPEVTIDVVGQKWSWTFNYKAADDPAVGQDVWERRHDQQDPRPLPPGRQVRCTFNLSSPDVIHSFLDAFRSTKAWTWSLGRHNSLSDATSDQARASSHGRCAELCGTYHSAMLFNVHVVSEDEYNTPT